MKIAYDKIKKQISKGGKSMGKYKCLACGYIYDEEKEEIKFEDLPENWVCPLCGVPKSMFEKVEEQV